MASQPVKGIIRQVKPILSTDSQEAKRRVLRLYKSWLRQIEPVLFAYKVPVPVRQARAKLREEFIKNKHVTDVRAIDMLVLKGQMELKEVMHKWKQECHIMYYFKPTQAPRSTNFLSKFFSGAD